MDNKLIKVLIEANKIKLPSFISIRNYQNANKEVSNYLINLGIEYPKQVQKDINYLNNVRYKNKQRELARHELLRLFTNNQNKDTRSNSSKAQIDAYSHIGNNIKIHNQKPEIYVYGYIVDKTIIKKGEYKSVNNTELTKQKNIIGRKLKTTKFRQFKLSEIKQIRINGERIDITI